MSIQITYCLTCYLLTEPDNSFTILERSNNHSSRPFNIRKPRNNRRKMLKHKFQ